MLPTLLRSNISIVAILIILVTLKLHGNNVWLNLHFLCPYLFVKAHIRLLASFDTLLTCPYNFHIHRIALETIHRVLEKKSVFGLLFGVSKVRKVIKGFILMEFRKC